MPSIWDINQEHKLLLSVIEVSNIKAINWALVAEKMGTAFTNEACRQHFSKIKKSTANDDTDIASSIPATPRKTAPAKANPSTPKTDSTPSKRKRSKSLAAVKDEAGDGQAKTKKARTEKLEVVDEPETHIKTASTEPDDDGLYCA